MVIALASLHAGRSLKIEDASDERRTRQALSNDLTTAAWNAPEVLQQTALEQLRGLGWRPGQSLYVILDDTQKRKRGKLMAAVSKIFLPAEKTYANGHTILGAAYVYRNVVIPCAVKLWAAKEACRKSQSEADPIDRLTFRTLTGMSADVIAGLPTPDGNVIVLFDSYYLRTAVLKACETRSFRYVGVAKKHRNFFPDGRPRDKRKLGRYGRKSRWILGIAMKPARRLHSTANRLAEHRLTNQVC